MSFRAKKVQTTTRSKRRAAPAARRSPSRAAPAATALPRDGARTSRLKSKAAGSRRRITAANHGPAFKDAPVRITVAALESRRKDAESRFQATFEQAAVGIAHTTTDGQFIRVNSKLCDILGYSSEQLLALTTRDLTHPDDRDRQDALRRELLAGKRRYFSANKRYLSKSGEQIWVNRTVTLAHGAARGERYLIQVIEDITERKRSEARVARLSQAHSVMAGCTKAMVRATAEPDLFQEICRTLVESGGYRQAWVGLAVDDAPQSIRIGGAAGFEPGYLESLALTWGSDSGRQGVMGHVIASGKLYIAQKILSDDRFSWRRGRALEKGYQSSITLPLKVDGRCVGGISIYAVEADAFDPEEIALGRELADDIAFGVSAIRTRQAREDAETRARDNARRFQHAFNQAAVGIVHADRDRNILAANHKFCEIVGYGEQEILQVNLGQVSHPDDREQDAGLRAQLIAGDIENFASEKRYVRRDGRIIWVRRTVSVARDESGDPQHYILVVEDVTERKEVEERFRTMFENAAVGITRVDLNGVLVDVNQKFCDMLGYSKEELSGKAIRDITDPGDFSQGEQFRARLVHGEVKSAAGEKRFVRKNGEIIWARRTMSVATDHAGNPQYVISVVEDITERKQTEARVARLSQARRVMTECSQALVRATSEPDLFHETCRILVESGGYRQAWVGLAVDDEEKSIKIGGSAGYEAGYLESLPRNWAGEGKHRGIMGHVIATGEPHVSQNILTDADLAERRARARDRNYQSSVSLPLKDQERIIGGISIYATESDAFDDEELSLLKGLVDDVAFGISVLRGRIAREQAEAKSREHERQFRETFDQAAVGIVHTSLDGKYLQVNRKFCDMLGFSESELLGQAAGDFTHFEDRDRGTEYRQPLWAGKLENFQEEKRYVRKDGRVIWTNRTVSLARDGSGKPLYFIRIIEDITDRKEVAERYRATFDNAPVGIMHTDVETDRILHANPKLCDMLGYTPDELLRMTTDQILDPEYRGTDPLHYREQILNGELGTFSSEQKFLRNDGSPIWVNRTVSLVRDAAGTPLYFIRIIEDISDRREAEDRLKHLAHYDALTGLPNRVLFHDRLRQALAQARRNNWVAAVLFIDLDRFKNVNDTLGHSAGDGLLKQVSERLAACVRSGDTVGRLGGDEFAIALTNIASPGDASVVAQKVRAALGGAFSLEGTEVFVTSSIGITLFPTDSDDLDVLIRNADTAMYRAKDLGRNNYQFYTPEMNAHALEKLSLENSLRRALERNEFLLYYQPKVSLATGEITGVEALLRWVHPEIGLVAPAEFMSMLEETGLIVPTGEWVIRAACAQLTAWRQAGVKPVSIAVNLSARQFQARDLGASIARILDKEGVEHGLLEFEITESSLVNNTEEAAQTLAFLNTLGVRVAIDDFGTGYSSLSYLKRLPLDALKIDGSFVRDITTDADDAAITRAIITMAHQLELSVIAEGVETEDQLNFLTANGCDQIQGYYFSFPLSAVECTALLKDERRLHRSAPAAPAEAWPVSQDGTAVLSDR